MKEKKIQKEKPIQVAYIELLNGLKLPFIHLTNKASKRGVYNDCYDKPCLTDFPDLMFAFNGKIFMREFGIEGRNLACKSRQTEKMCWWALNGKVHTLTINNLEGMREDWKNIGLVK